MKPQVSMFTWQIFVKAARHAGWLVCAGLLLSGCGSAFGRKNEMAAQCRAQAMADTKSLPGPGPYIARERLYQDCMRRFPA